MKKYAIITFAILIIVLIVGCSSPSPTTPASSAAKPSASSAPSAAAAIKTVKLTVDNYSPPSNPGTRALHKFIAPEIEKRSGGTIKLEIFDGGALGNANETIDRVESGAVDIGYVSTSYSSGRFWYADAPSMAFLVPNLTISGAVMTRLIQKGLLDKEFGNAKPLWAWGATSYNFLLTKIKATTVAEMKGLKIRGPGGIQNMYLEAIGAIPVKTAGTEMYSAAQTGVVDGIAVGSYALLSFKLQEVIKYQMRVQFCNLGAYWAINRGVWNKLSPEQQKVMNDIAMEANIIGSQGYMNDDIVAAAQAAKSYGVVTYDIGLDDRAKLQDTMNAVTQKVINDVVKERGDNAKAFYKELADILAEYELPFSFKY